MKNIFLTISFKLLTTLLLILSTNTSCFAQKFMIKDSVYERWSVIADKIVDSRVGQIAIDSAGSLYALLVETDKSKSIMKYENYFWKPFGQGISDKVNYISTDSYGRVYARTNERVYKLTATGWTKIFERANNNLPTAQYDGKLYGKNTKYHKTKYHALESKIDLLENGTYLPLGKGGTPLFLPHPDDKFTVDHKGVIYAYEDHYYGTPQTEVTIYRFDGEKWNNIGLMPCDINDDGFDNYNNWYVSGRDKSCVYFKKWDGSNWTDMTLPEEVSKEDAFGYFEPLFDESGNLYTKGYDPKTHKYVLFRFEGQKWKEAARGDEGMNIDFFIPTEHAVYGMDDYNKKFYRYTGRWVVKQMEVENLVRTFEPNTNFYNFYSSGMEQWYVFEQNGLKGLQDKTGKILIHPAFNKITAVKTPASALQENGGEETDGFSEFSLELVSGNETFYASIHDLRYTTLSSSNALPGLKKRIASTCSYCGGDGEIAERTETVKRRGDWVDGTTSYSTGGESVWVPGCNCYQWVKTYKSTSSQGYYKPDTHETITIPGGKCDACSGKGIFREYEVFNYNSSLNRYARGWK